MFDQDFMAIYVITILAVISPGPDFALTLKNSLQSGRLGGLMTAAGIACGVSVHISYTVFGMGYILTDNTWLIDAMKFCGAAYLIWLGISSFYSRGQTSTLKNDGDHREQGLSKSFRQGFFCNAANPKTALFFLALFSQVVSPEVSVPGQIGLGIFIAVTHFVWFSIVALLLTNDVIKGPILKCKKWLERLTGAFLFGLGAKIMVSTN